MPLSLSSFRFWDGVHLGGGVGRLSLDVYDTADKQLVWRGSATRTLDDKASPQKRQDNINKATAKLLKNYRPPAKK